MPRHRGSLATNRPQRNGEMAGLGLILSWSGYMLAVWGVSKMKAGNGGTPLSISDIVLPSHRAAYIAAMSPTATTASTASTAVGVQPNGQTLPASTVGNPAETITRNGKKYVIRSP